MALPKLTPEQRQAALEKAMELRHARAALRADLKAGKMTLAEVLDKADDPVIGRIKVSSLLESMPGYGKARSEKLMAELDIAASRRVKGLGANQREQLLKAFEK